MKKEASGKIFFAGYFVFLLMIAILNWKMYQGYFSLVLGLLALVVLVGAVMQFFPSEVKVLRGYAVVAVVAVFLSAASFFAMIRPEGRGALFVLLLVSLGIVYHSIRALSPKVS